MASSSSPTAHSSPLIDVEAESETRESYLQILSKSCIFIPTCHVNHMIESGFIDTFVLTIEESNFKRKELTKKFYNQMNLKRTHENGNKNNEKQEEGRGKDDDDDDQDGPIRKKRQQITSADVSTQTDDNSKPIFIDPTLSDHEAMEPDLTHIIKSFYDSD